MIAAVAMCSAVYLSRCAMVVSEATAGEYVEWVEAPGNGLHASRTAGGYVFDVQYKPAEYVVLREQLLMPASEAEMKDETAQLADMQYFTFRISREDSKDLLQDDVATSEDYSSRLVYFTGAMQHDLSLVQNGDTLPCMLFHFERTFGVDARSTFLLGFPQTGNETASDKTFVFEDHELGTGPVLVTIEKESIKNIPLLKLN